MWKPAVRTEDSSLHDVNMTPLIDVSLVLVVILLLATPLAFESSIAVRRAAQSGRSADQQTDVARVELSVLSEDEVRINKSVVARADLGPALRSALATSPAAQVVVRCADEVSHGTFVGVLDEAKANGALQLAVVGR